MGDNATTPDDQPLETADDQPAEPLEEVPAGGELKAEPDPPPVMPEATAGGAPSWVKIPPGMKFPKGVPIVFTLFRADWTRNVAKGDRQCISWGISVGDKKLAFQRAMNDQNRAVDELTKQMIRAVDGHVVDWSGAQGPGNVETFWEEIGEGCRAELSGVFVRLNLLSKEQKRDFFENCVAVRVLG